MKNKLRLFSLLVLPAAFAYGQSPYSLYDVTQKGSSTDKFITVETPAGGAMFTGRQIGTGYGFNYPYGAVFYAKTDASYPDNVYFYSGYHGTNSTAGSGTNTFYVRADGQGYFAKRLGIGIAAPSVALDVAGSGRFSTNVTAYTATPLGATSYQTGNFQAAVQTIQYDGGARPGYGFHALGRFATYLYADGGLSLKLKSDAGTEATVLTTANMGTEGNFARAGVQPPANMSTLTSRTFLGSINGQLDAPVGDNTVWWNIINVRHRNGESDGNRYGMQLINGMTNYNNHLYFRTQFQDNWSDWKQIWHNGNLNPANYFPVAGGNITGDVKIGAINNPKNLAVDGNIKTRKITVTQTNWPDYVFDSAYRLSPLTQVEAYIQANKHLPEVPAATTVEKEGVELAANQALLLKKIEELTLYIIQQNKDMETLKKQVSDLQQKIK
ncbi:hypothetical protein HNQ91_003295 [Filimonas zeae]|uniref:Chaperone of endosialidase n=1 Tax=Filimonas zeae TaxID=1737353 RepID=A0A917IZJ8_9BACT|nr:hypothetical protein [Filimonas zeae]MDR6340230.1 hypothetical protein [Filimonas zeae]GGH71763.1 hypothetical protein GCM10011379_31450 [Filimonas zeae]